jgi:hypothetical protein
MTLSASAITPVATRSSAREQCCVQGIPYLLRVVPDVHLDSSTCKSARSRASQSRHHAPRVLKGSSARIVLRDIEKRSPSTTIGECPYRAFFRLAEALEGLADGKTLSSKLEKICERA